MNETAELNSVRGLILDAGFINYILGSDTGQELIWHTRISTGAISSAVFERAKASLLGIFHASSLTRKEKEDMYNCILQSR